MRLLYNRKLMKVVELWKLKKWLGLRRTLLKNKKKTVFACAEGIPTLKQQCQVYSGDTCYKGLY